MPKRTDINSVMIIGAGPIVIGQACEFDYSGVQACKALREEGYRIILVNSNPATIMTDSAMADATYIEPLTWQSVAEIIAKERPDTLLPTMGGQTGLNCAADLVKNGILEKYKVELIGASFEAIDTAEDRMKFKAAMDHIGLESAKSAVVHSIEEAIEAQAEIGYPTIIRPSFTLGGTGGGIAYNREEFVEICKHGLDLSPTRELLIEESVLGWKEIEMEVIRDSHDHCMIVCSIENLDPMGIHTGDSITVAPAQTLTDREAGRVREASLAIMRKINVTAGGANIQFAMNPKDGRLIVIELNPRVSRSSALASKATGFPIAKISAKLAVGYSLMELKNEITGNVTIAGFEPTIDYVVLKVPRFAFEKFPQANDRLTTQMKSVGEVMSIGRTFQECLQKSLRGLETGVYGFDEKTTDTEKIREEIMHAGPERIWYVADAFRVGMSVAEIQAITAIDPWFLGEIEELISIEQKVRTATLDALDATDLRFLKEKGFSDIRLAQLLKVHQDDVRNARHQFGVRPVYKRVDTCGGEFKANKAYFFSTYDQVDEARPTESNQKIIVLGGGPNRIGQGIEFDYCCVHAAFALREDGYETIMINCNPETVSTDYDTSDRLYFEPLTLEDVLEIVHIEKPLGVIVQYGGQTPLKLAKDLERLGVPIIGTTPDMIDCAEDRERFKELLATIGLTQPANRTAMAPEDAMTMAEEIGYPLVVRPSYVLGGRAMEIVHQPSDLERYMREAVKVSHESPVLLDRFLNDATEVDVDALSDGKDILIGGIMEHIEQAGVHSGDSACSLPPYSLSRTIQDEIRRQTRALAKALNVIGLMNIQFAIQDDKVFVLEVNPRASRTVPFVSKAIGLPLAKVAARCMAGQTLAAQGVAHEQIPSYYCVKEAVFPFNKFAGVDTILGPEMKSTGEVMGVGKTFGEAFYKSQLAAGVSLVKTGKAFISVKDEDKSAVTEIAKNLTQQGYAIVATHGTADTLREAGIEVSSVNKVKEGRPHIVDMIKDGNINLIINTVGQQPGAIQDSRSIRTSAIEGKVTYYTTIAGAKAAVSGISSMDTLEPYRLQDMHPTAIV